jgi:tetratricopeptide (TPR) repeat protein
MLRGTWVTVLASSALALAQIPGVPANGSSSNGPQNSGTSSSGMGSNSGASSPGAGSSAGANAGNLNRMVRSGSSGLPGDSPRTGGPGEPISGRVILGDGDEPGAGIIVQRVCGSMVAGEARTDSRGRFNLSRAIGGSGFTADTSRSNVPDGSGCELRATLSGYQAGAVPLGNGRSSGGGEVLIVLHRAGSASSMTISATFLLAPKNARKSYDNGLEALRRHAPDRAQKDFAEAVRIYPRFAAAWLELGKVYEQRDHKTEAREAYAKAIAADGEYLLPYQRLYRMDIRESRWKEAADTSNRVLRLNPYEFAEAYYFNAVANLELNLLDVAERSAREAAKLEGAQAEPRGNYVLGVILWRKGDLDGAADKMQTFLADAPGGPEQTSGQKMLADIERQQARQRAREEAGR